MPAAGVLWSSAVVAALVTMAACGWAAYRVRGSTAVPAALWALAAAAALAAEMACRAAGGLGDPATAAAVRLAVGALGVCPAMSLLGAKRPQHGVWQFIVAALAVVIALPAASSTFVRPGTMPDVNALWRCFLAMLVAVGWMNFAATRRGAAATLVAAGQFLLLRRFLPFATATSDASGAPLDAAGACLVAAGAVIAAVQSAIERPRASVAPGIDRPFLALRDTLGAAWALRIAERFNAVAAERGWPCRLGFAGVEPATAPDGAWRPAADRAFRALARRFASADWLRRHGESDRPMAPTVDGR
jgi:hypothetical protein